MVKKTALKKPGVFERVEEEIEEIEEVLSSKKARRVERYVIFGLYIVVFLVAMYFLIQALIPKMFISGTYSISAIDSDILSNVRSLYIDKTNILAGQIDVDNRSLRLITSAEPFNIVFNPKNIVPDNTSAELIVDFYDVKTDVYLDNKLIIPNLFGYIKVKEFDDKEIWVKGNLVNENLSDGENVMDYIYQNFPNENVYSFSELEGTPIVQGYKQNTTLINTTFRDNLKLAVYVEDELDVRLTKQDLNWYIGKDECNVTVSDFSGNVYFSRTYEDDGDAKDSSKTGKEQPFIIRLNNLSRNIYFITFTRDSYNQAADFSIKDIKINSNKVLIIGRFLPLTEFDFFVRSDYPWKIGLNYWHSGKDQKIPLKGTENITIDLDKNWMNKKYEEEIARGDYAISLPKGDLWVYTDFVAINEGSWFYPPQEIGKKLIDSDVIIIDKDILEINEKKFHFRKDVNVSKDTKFKLQIIDETMAYFERAELII